MTIPPIQQDDTAAPKQAAPGTDQKSLEDLYYKYRDQGLSAEDAEKIVRGHKALLSAPPSAMDTWIDYTVDHAMGHLNRPMDAMANMLLNGGDYKTNRLMVDQKYQDEQALHPGATGTSTAVAGAVLNPLNKLPGGVLATGAEIGGGTALENSLASIGTPSQQTLPQAGVNAAIGAGGGAILGKVMEPVTGAIGGLIKGARGELSNLSDNVINGVENMFKRYGTDFNKVAQDAQQNPEGRLIEKFAQEANVAGKISPVAKKEIQGYLNDRTGELTSVASKGIPEKMAAFAEPNISLESPSGQRLAELIQKDPALGKAFSQAQQTLGKEKLPDLPQPGQVFDPFGLSDKGEKYFEKNFGLSSSEYAEAHGQAAADRLKQVIVKAGYGAPPVSAHPGFSIQSMDLMRENLMQMAGGAKTEAEKQILNKSLSDEFLPIVNKNSPSYELYQAKSGAAINALNAHQGLEDQVTQGWGHISAKDVTNAFLGKPGFSFSGGLGPWNVAINTAKQLFGKSVTPADADQLAHLLVQPQGEAMQSIMTNYAKQQNERLLQAKLTALGASGAAGMINPPPQSP